MVSVQKIIQDKLTKALNPIHLEIINESHMHSVPQGSESHFKAIVVSDSFEGKPSIKRHRMVYTVLAEELKNQIHALALHVFSPKEWQQAGHPPPSSPPCFRGSQNEQGS